MMKHLHFKKPLFRKRLYLSTKPYFLKRSRKDGEKDLERLVDTSNLECSWLFDVSNSLWYNICFATEKVPHEDGINELRTKTYSIDLTKFKKVSRYHFHPKIIEEELKKILNPPTNQRAKELMESYAAFCVAMPSGKDISQDLATLNRNPSSSVDFRIASSRGIIIINFGRPIKSEFCEEKYSNILEHKNLIDIISKTRNPNEAISHGINYINEAMNQVFTMRFEYRDGELK